MYKIDKNVTPPAKGRTVYPFAQMEIGDSFMAPGIAPRTLYQAAFSYSRRHGGKFSTRAENDGARCWKIA